MGIERKRNDNNEITENKTRLLHKNFLKDQTLVMRKHILMWWMLLY